MARTKVVPQIASRAGVLGAPFTCDATNGNYAAPFTGFEVFMFANGGSSDYAVTFSAQSTDPRGNKTNLAVTVAHVANATMATALIVGPFQYADWYDAVTGGIDFSVDGGASTHVTGYCITLPVYNPSSSTGG